MYLFTFRARVSSKFKKEPEYTNFGGAYVNCWISFKDRDGAEELAKYYIKQSGWVPEVRTAESKVQKKWCKKKTDKQYYSEAVKHGYILIFNRWPKDAPDANHDYESPSEQLNE